MRKILPSSGLLLFRIQHLSGLLKEAKTLSEWTQRVGTLAHYLADLTMPLHLTKHYDGNSEALKGIHHQFETAAVDALDYELLRSKVRRLASAKLRKTTDKKMGQKVISFQDHLQAAFAASRGRVDAAFAIGLRNGKHKAHISSIRKAKAFEPLIIKGLADAVELVTLAMRLSSPPEPQSAERYWEIKACPPHPCGESSKDARFCLK